MKYDLIKMILICNVNQPENAVFNTLCEKTFKLPRELCHNKSFHTYTHNNLGV